MASDQALNCSLFTDREMQVLAAVCDTLAPSLDVPSDGFYARSASDLNVPQAVANAVETAAGPSQQQLAKIALDLLDQPTINVLFGGPFKSFVNMTPDERTAVLRSWAQSDLE